MLYVIISKDKKDSIEQRLKTRPAHLARIEQLHHTGRLILAGPLPKTDSAEHPELGFSGSLVVAEFDSLAHARQWADEDPYQSAGVFESSQVFPFKQVLP